MLNRQGYWMIFLAVILGILAGIWQVPFILKAAELISEIFVRLLKLISLPIISLSLLATMSSVGEQSLSRVGKRIVSYTLLTTIIAASLALVFYVLIHPLLVAAPSKETVALATPAYLEELIKMIPNNLLQPFLEGNVVSIMLLSLLLGVALAQLPTEQRAPLHSLLQSLFLVMMRITRWIVAWMPLAIWGFIVLFIEQLMQGLSFSKIGWYLLTILLANLFQALIVLPLFLKAHGISPAHVFFKMLPALSFAFFSKSSSAALPSAIDCAERSLKVSPTIARFSFPLCTSINMNACAAFILITVLFVAQSHGMHFSAGEKILWVGIATIAAIGNAGVPMGCFFIASALLSAMNVPLTLMGIILPFYALLDMLESAINIWSDACVTLAVDEREKRLG